MICVCGLHGNELPGVLALQRLLPRLERDPRGLRGRLVGLAGNRQALERGQRFLEEDLNRIWFADRLARLRAGGDAVTPEESELRELDAALEHALAECSEASVLDLHSTSGNGPAFTSLDDTLANRAMAFDLPVPHVLGLEEELSGTLVGYLNQLGITAIGFEAGQHSATTSVDHAEAAVWIAMESCGVLEPGVRDEVARARELLARNEPSRPGVVEVRHRHPVVPGDGFAMLPGFRCFQPVRAGEQLARDARGPITSPRSGLILMPLYQQQGGDGFFVIHRVHPAWLALSAFLRRLRVDRFAHWLPGVKRHPELAGAFHIDRASARWFALQVFHLLGFRRYARTETTLEMVRREPLKGARQRPEA